MKFIVLLLSLIIFSSATEIKKEYYKDGSIWTEAEYKNNMKNGILKVYYPSGQLAMHKFYINDKTEGFIIEYYKNGLVKSITPHQKNKPNGTARRYCKDGSLEYELIYKNGLLHPSTSIKKYKKCSF